MNPLRAVVAAVQFFAAAAALAFVVLLFVNEPDVSDSPASGGAASDPGGGSGQVDGAAIYAENCARCHGDDGGGGVGPQLSEGQVVTRFPSIEDEIAVVTDGAPGGMPSFGGQLSEEEVRAVVEYTRTL